MNRQPVAIITPVPNQSTGIADYAAGLIRGLRSVGHDVTVFTQGRFLSQSADRLGQVHAFADFDPSEWMPEATIYQIGNNSTFHDEIVLGFLRNGGVAHLHDLSLHHLFAYFTYLEDAEVYYALIARWYGADVAARIRAHHDAGRPGFWEGSEVLDYPLNEEVISKACAVIVHSEFAKTQIQRTFPGKPVFVVPQRYPDALAIKRRRGPILRVASLGFVDPNKRVDVVIAAIAQCRDRGVEVHLEIAGRLHADCLHLAELCRNLRVDDLVTFHGELSSSDFASIYGATDACIVLRDPTVGETSAIVSRALQYGVPLLVNDVGSYSELPPFVIKMPVGEKLCERLASHLMELATNPVLYGELADAAFEYGAQRGTFSLANKLYSDVIAEIVASKGTN